MAIQDANSLGVPLGFYERDQGQVVRLYGREAPEQQRVLDAFEKDGWPELIDNPRQHLAGDNRKAQFKSLVAQPLAEDHHLVATVHPGSNAGRHARPLAAHAGRAVR